MGSTDSSIDSYAPDVKGERILLLTLQHIAAAPQAVQWPVLTVA